MEWYLVLVFVLGGELHSEVVDGPFTGPDCTAAAEAQPYNVNHNWNCELAQ